MKRRDALAVILKQETWSAIATLKCDCSVKKNHDRELHTSAPSLSNVLCLF